MIEKCITYLGIINLCTLAFVEGIYPNVNEYLRVYLALDFFH